MLIVNCRIVTWGKQNQLLENQAVLIKGQKIERIDLQSKLISEFPHEEQIDGNGQILMPGLICAHTHFYGAFSRGMAIPGEPPADFSQILQKLWWPLDQSLILNDVKYSALVCMIDAIRHGTTTLFDHHASPNAIEGSLDSIEQCFIESGLRGVECYEVTDRGGLERSDDGIKENVRFIEKMKQGGYEGRIAAIFGLHASLTLSEKTLEKSRAAVDSSTGFHIHVAEHQVDEYDSLQKTGLRVIDRLKKHGMLGQNSIIAHGVHMDMREVEQLAETQTWLSHQPRSNMNNAVGMADIDSLLRMGVKVCLGNDGFSNAMWDEYRTCYLVHKLWNKDPQRMNGGNLAKIAFVNNADIASHFFPNNGRIGVIEEGAQADLILVDYLPFTELTPGNLPWHIQFGFSDSMVTSTMVAGKWLMKDRKLMTLDEVEITRRALDSSKEVWKRYQKQF
ncbi:MAG: putative aminohydrolase SsnA [Anaerolineaceae bacterium]